MTHRAYIACGFADRELYGILEAAVLEVGWEVSYRWPDHEPPSDPIERRQYRTEQSAKEIDAVTQASDMLIVGLPGGYGTASELGAALGAGVPVVLYGHVKYVGADPVNVFLDHPGVYAHVTSPRQLVHVLRTSAQRDLLQSMAEHLRYLDLDVNAKLSPPAFAADRKNLLAEYERIAE